MSKKHHPIPQPEDLLNEVSSVKRKLDELTTSLRTSTQKPLDQKELVRIEDVLKDVVAAINHPARW